MEEDQWFCEDCQEVHFTGQTCVSLSESAQTPGYDAKATNEEIKEQWDDLPYETRKHILKEFGELMGPALWYAFAKTYGFKK